MDKMEVEEESPQESNSITKAITIWSVINEPILGIFSDLTKPGTEQGLRSFLEHSITLSNVLSEAVIPPVQTQLRCDIHEKYTTFSTWFVGILFHVLVTPMSNENLESTMKIQAGVLNNLYVHFYKGFTTIFSRYISIVDKIIELMMTEKEEVVIEEFVVEPHLIEGLNLLPCPVQITTESTETVLMSIMKVLIKSGVVSSNHNDLWDRILLILKISSPKVKIIATQVIAEMITHSEVQEKHVQAFLASNFEILESLSGSSSLIDTNNILEYAEILAGILKNLEISTDMTDLCLIIVKLVSCGKIISQELQSVACRMILNYLNENPRGYSAVEVKNFVAYSENCPEFTKILAHFVAFDLTAHIREELVLNVGKLSNLWLLLIKNITQQSPDFNVLKRVLEIARMLTNWSKLQQCHVRFFDSTAKLPEILFAALEQYSNDVEKIETIFLCFVDMMALEEFHNDKIQNILLLPWLQAGESSIYGDKNTVAMAKTLNVSTKMKILRGICEFGWGKSRLKYLSSCVTGRQVEFGEQVLLHSVFLLADDEISFNDINTHILKPVLIVARLELAEALATALAQIICVVSGKGKIARSKWDSPEWFVHCDVCVNNEFCGDFDEKALDSHNETLFQPYLVLFTEKYTNIRAVMVKNLLKFSNHLRIFNTNDVAAIWLPLMYDPSLEIRTELVNSIEKLVRNRIAISTTCGNKTIPEDDWPEELTEFMDLFIAEVATALDDALENSKHCQQLTLLNTVVQFAKIPIFHTEEKVCTVFIITIIDPQASSVAVSRAIMAYSEVAGFWGLKPKDLFIRYKKDLMGLIIRKAADNFTAEIPRALYYALYKVTSCVDYLGPREFLRKHGHLAMSILVPLTVQAPHLQPLLEEVANITGVDEDEMMNEYFQHICPHVLINESPKVAIQSLQLISTRAKISLKEKFRLNYLEIFRELLLHFHESMPRVVRCLEIISKFQDASKTKLVFDTEEKLVKYLKPQLHAVLVHFDSNLCSLSSDDFTQRSALASLATLIKFMGAELSKLKYNILATLRTSLGFTRPGFRDLAWYAWDSFIRNIPLEDLGPLLPTICISLIPLLEFYPEKTNAMLEYLIVDNNAAMSLHINELFFINDLQVSPRILNVVNAQIKRSTAENNFEENLRLWNRRIVHETDEVRLKALIYLENFLENHRGNLNDMILNDSNHVHDAIVQLLDALLAGCQHKDNDVRLKSGECLGELGAIEPSLLPRRIVSRKDSKFIADMTENFAAAMLDELIRAFHQVQNNSQSVECVALALQELLKTYDISPEGGNRELFNSLSPTVQKIIEPFLTSHYKSITSIDPISYPIYGTDAGSTFEKWILNWVCCMIISIKDANLAGLLASCRPAFKRDTRTMIFCIPHIVTYTIIAGDDTDRDGLIREIMGVLKFDNKKIDDELIKRRPLWTQSSDVESTENRNTDEARRIRCAHVIFATVDHLQRWLDEKRKIKDGQFKSVEAFFARLDLLVLAEACYKSHEYHRALIYLERHMESSHKALDDPREGGLLSKIYKMLKEPDGVLGILASQAQYPTISQLVLAHKANGQLEDAVTCYERLAQCTSNPEVVQGMIDCYLGLEQPFTAMKVTQAMINSTPSLEAQLTDTHPFWRLAQFAQLEVEQTGVKNSFAESLLLGVQPDLQAVKKSLVTELAAASHQECAYQQNYAQITTLHIINEFEKMAELILRNIDDLPKLLTEWQQRLELVRGSRGVEFVLRMRRAALDLAVQVEEAKIENSAMNHDGSRAESRSSVLQQEIGKIWLKSAKIARKAGMYQQAYMYVLSASDHCPPQELHIEEAQLHWQRGKQEDAFITLKRAFSTCFQEFSHYKAMPLEVKTDERRHFAKAKLLFAKYNEETVNVAPEINKMYFREAMEAWRSWDKSLLALAQHYEATFNRMPEGERDGPVGSNLQTQLVSAYGKTLMYGCKYVHQAMPRMLTIWMNFALKMHGNHGAPRSVIDNATKMSKTIDHFVKCLPKFMWLTAMSQLVSRICHPAKEVQNHLNNILVKLIDAYPQYCLWMMAAVINSSYPARKKRCQEILSSPTLDTANMKRLIRDFNMLWEKLIELSNKPISKKIDRTTVSMLSKNLPRLLSHSSFGPIMMPTSNFTQVHLPHNQDRSNDSRHNPFPINAVNIVGIIEEVMVMFSLARPRKISLLGSDGKHYSFMCKPKDDLRRDFRLMEFNGIVNKYLQKDPESLQRRLYIRTYSVFPLNEECGLIEWVPNLVGFRKTIMDLYEERGLGMNQRDIVAVIPDKRESLDKKKDVFLNKLLPRHPPVLGYWLKLNFPDAYGWYEARNAYIRTTAVVSMAGYILGLGDRHGENILFDSKCGDCVHVDFNCLFNQGENFEWPERVPFRLTHNMVNAMGPLGFEGPFRRCCQITMRILRQQASTLISVLTPFVYDPLVNWSTKESSDNAERTNEKAVNQLKNIEARLNGIVKSFGSAHVHTAEVSLSVEGQTNHLILDATSVDNLCQMYHGWSAYL